MGDAQVFIRTAAFNMDVAGFFSRWLVDVNHAQFPDGATSLMSSPTSSRVEKSIRARRGSPAWSDAGIICPWTLYVAYGDQRCILETCYSSMSRYIDYLDRRSADGLHPGGGYGDWLAIGSDTNKELIGTAYSAYSISLMRRIARILGEPEDEQRFALLFGKFKAAFNREFVTPAGRLTSRVSDGGRSRPGVQARGPAQPFKHRRLACQ